ncbi:MAG: hypothetical protein WC564_00275 [Patescibacteria group bacterium]|jgi:hypothetical protein
MKKKFVLFIVLIVFCLQSFSQQIEFDCKKDSSGKEVVYVFSLVTIKEVKDTLLHVDENIPIDRQIEAYNKGFAIYDSNLTFAYYNVNYFWVTRIDSVEYKLVKFDKAKKEITQTDVVGESLESDFIIAIIVFLVCAVICSALLLIVIRGKYTSDDIQNRAVFGLWAFLPWICNLVFLFFCFSFSMYNSEAKPLVGGLLALSVIQIIVALLLGHFNLWSKTRFLIVESVGLSIILASVGAVTGSLALVACFVATCLLVVLLLLGILILISKRKKRIK